MTPRTRHAIGTARSDTTSDAIGDTTSDDAGEVVRA